MHADLELAWCIACHPVTECHADCSGSKPFEAGVQQLCCSILQEGADGFLCWWQSQLLGHIVL